MRFALVSAMCRQSLLERLRGAFKASIGLIWGHFRTAHTQHSACTAPIITLFILGTPLKTTYLQKHA